VTSHQKPLAERLRPQKLEDIVGQGHLLNKDGILTQTVASGQPQSFIFWGPAGCGKTTLARCYATAFNARFVSLSAVFSGVADVKQAVKDAKANQNLGETTILFIDEIHRFNKAQQDAFLPFVEDGTLILIGATTENPSFELNNALLSRAQALTLKALTNEDLKTLFTRAQTEIPHPLNLTQNAEQTLLNSAQGDGRYLLNLTETLANTTQPKQEINTETLNNILTTRAASYDKNGDNHYNLISALHKSIRGSDPNASLYWFARMLEGGEDPLYLARRLIRMAAEDIGLADPTALTLATAAREAYHIQGSPEGELALAEVVVYLALAPKSNAIYTAYNAARQLAKQTHQHNPPKIILNGHTKLMKQENYGKDYIYDPDTEHGFSGQNYFPDAVAPQTLYTPVNRGFEREMQKRINYFNKLRQNIDNNKK